ncbi:unnamed protein product [Merluccius merluccius]
MRSNLRIVHIPENIEGGDIKQFTTDLLNSVLQTLGDQPGPELERVHQIGPKPGDRGKARTIILKLLWFEDKQRIL